MDIGGWLRSLGLEQYEAAFRENKVDATVLPKADGGRPHFGVAAVGDRRKLLEAIEDLRSGKKAEPSPFEASRYPAPTKDTAAERRQVTVMFSDLVGSTALSGRMDPEDLREVISAYQKCVAETVQRFGGFVAKYMGDEVLVYFGYPQAHEDDAERAVRSGPILHTKAAAEVLNVRLQTDWHPRTYSLDNPAFPQLSPGLPDRGFFLPDDCELSREASIDNRRRDNRRPLQHGSGALQNARLC